MRYVLLICAFLFPPLAQATTWYADYASGSDSNNGTSKSTPWKNMPGMPTCASVCASPSPSLAAGDHFILKGGVTWPMNTVGCWYFGLAGASGNLTYIGVDKTWYTGSAWNRPILNGNAATISACADSVYTNTFLDLIGSYITVDNIEFTGALWGASVPPNSNLYLVSGASGNHDTTYSNNYFHGWANTASGSAGDDQGNIFSMESQTSLLPLANNVAVGNVVDASDTAPVIADPTCSSTCLSSGSIRGYFSKFENNVVRYLAVGLIGSFTQVDGNLIEYVRSSIDPTQHENGLENNSDCNAVIYNNVFRHFQYLPQTPGGYVGLWVAPQPACTDYVFNNVFYDLTPSNIIDTGNPLGSSPPYGSVVIANNTVECGPDGVGPGALCTGCAGNGYTACTFENNHWITSASPATICSGGPTCTTTSNITQTLSAACLTNSYCSSQTFAFSPTSSSSPTATTSGVNLYSLATGSLASLASDTSYGCVEISSPYVQVSCPTRIVNPRGISGAWQVGAYWFGSAPPPPNPLPAPNITPFTWNGSVGIPKTNVATVVAVPSKTVTTTTTSTVVQDISVPIAASTAPVSCVCTLSTSNSLSCTCTTTAALTLSSKPKRHFWFLP